MPCTNAQLIYGPFLSGAWDESQITVYDEERLIVQGNVIHARFVDQNKNGRPDKEVVVDPLNRLRESNKENHQIRIRIDLKSPLL